MKRGDLVVWRDLDGRRGQRGIIVDGPRQGSSGGQPAERYRVAWFEARTTYWHLDFNMEVISENR